MRIRIRDGRVLDPANGVDQQLDVFIADGKIVALATQLDNFSADREIDAHGHWVIPGLVDLAARLREPGLEHKATIESETRAAAAAGRATASAPSSLSTSSADSTRRAPCRRSWWQPRASPTWSKS